MDPTSFLTARSIFEILSSNFLSFPSKFSHVSSASDQSESRLMKSLVKSTKVLVECIRPSMFENSVSSLHRRLRQRRRVLVVGQYCMARAIFLSEDSQFPSQVYSLDEDIPANQSGVFYASGNLLSARELASTFDAVLCVDISASRENCSVYSHVHTLLRQGGFFAGAGFFSGLVSTRNNLLNPVMSMKDFRNQVEDSGFFMQVLSPEDLPSSGRSGCYGRFLATKVPFNQMRKTKSEGMLADLTLSRPETKLQVVISGVSIGLPNELYPERPVFSSDNFDQIFSGTNFISNLTKEEKQAILDKRPFKVLKVKGKRLKQYFEHDEHLIQLASKLGNFDLVKEYGIPPHVVECLDSAYELAVAAGLEALKDAGIELTDGGDPRKGKFMLPQNMRDETGVIFASSFPGLNSMVDEVTRAVSSLKDSTHSALPHSYDYNRKLLFKLLVMANNQLAELIQARGPNIQMNTACSSTSQAISIAEDWLRVGRCKRVLVISGDHATSKELLPYLGTGFMALGAATIKKTIETAAVPFDKSRTGMILGCGACGLVLETESSCTFRNGFPKVELIASHVANSAFHAAMINRQHVSAELERMLRRLEEKNLIPSRAALARDLIYFSHETGTSSNGGCAKAETDCLQAAFGSSMKDILICNTKGLTGHPMGVGIEDVVAVESLCRNLVPPVPHLKQTDPCLGEINLSCGGTHSRKFVLRFAAGFGSQVCFTLIRRWVPSRSILEPKKERSLVNSTSYPTLPSIFLPTVEF